MPEITSCPVCHGDKDVGVKLRQCLRCKAIAYCGSNCQKQDWPVHKKHCRAENYILEVELVPSRIANPPVTRVLSCPAAATFMDLHKALQVAFGWASTHTFDFKIKDPDAKPLPDFNMMEYIEKMRKKDMADLKAMREGKPAPEEDKGPRQYRLRIVQFDKVPQGWARPIDLMHNSSRVHPETPEIIASKIKVRDILEDCKLSPFEYEYDFGDSWEHVITVTGRAATTDIFVCTSGVGHWVAEDVGSDMGWKSLLEAYRAKSPSKEQKQQMNWFERLASNADPLGLGNGRDRFFDRNGVNTKLARI